MAPVKCVSYPDPDSILAGDSGFRTKEEKGPTKKMKEIQKFPVLKPSPHISVHGTTRNFIVDCVGVGKSEIKGENQH
jgi:hypothetical protein